MSELLLENGTLNKVMGVATGPGYQTTVLSQLADRMFSVEWIEVLQDRAKERLVLIIA